MTIRLILKLAIKLVMPITQDAKSKELLLKELVPLMSSVRAMDRLETENIGRGDLAPWADVLGLSNRRPDLIRGF